MHQSLGNVAEYSPAVILTVSVAMASSNEEYLKSDSKIGLLGHNDMFCSGSLRRWSGKNREWG